MAGAATPAAEIGRTIRRIVAARLTEIVELPTNSGEQLDNNPPEARVIAVEREALVAQIVRVAEQVREQALGPAVVRGLAREREPIVPLAVVPERRLGRLAELDLET
jgi:hypothetical protein